MSEEENKEIVNCEHWFAGECMKFGGLCKDYKVESCSIKKTIDEEIKELKAEHEKEIVLQQNNNALLIAKLSKDSEQLKARIKELEEETKELKKGVASGICANTFRKNTGLSKGGEK